MTFLALQNNKTEFKRFLVIHKCGIVDKPSIHALMVNVTTSYKYKVPIQEPIQVALPPMNSEQSMLTKKTMATAPPMKAATGLMF